MGFVDFAKNAGRKIGLFGGRKAAEADAAKKEALAAATAAKEASDAAAKEKLGRDMLAADVKAAVLSYVQIDDLGVSFDGTQVVLTGAARTQADKERAVLVAGNTEGVARVDDRIAVGTPEPAAIYHTVVTGDTLSQLAGRYYGVIGLYDSIFQANQPMLEHPDRIYPGQVLRIPPVKPPVHTVARGETLATIAERWYGDRRKYTLLAAHNGITDPNQLDAGQALTIPLLDPRVG